MSELSIHELETQNVAVLPERETLGAIVVTNTAVAEQAFTILSANVAIANQHVAVIGNFVL